MQKYNFQQNDSYENLDNCSLIWLCICIDTVVPLWANQLLSQLLMNEFNTLHTQYRHIEDMHERVCE